jgi:type 1 glutamine amidotransferase
VEATDLFIPFLRERGFRVEVFDSPAPYADADLMADTDVIMQCMTMSTIESEQSDNYVPHRINVLPAAAEHPITDGLGDFDVVTEQYSASRVLRPLIVCSGRSRRLVHARPRHRSTGATGPPGAIGPLCVIRTLR